MALGLPRDVAGSVYGLFNSYKNRNKAIRDKHINTSLLSRYYNKSATDDNTLTVRNKFLATWLYIDINDVSSVYLPLLNELFYLIEKIETPNLTIKDGVRIDEGRGPYQTQSDSIPTTTGNTLDIIYRETQTPIIESLVSEWMYNNSIQFKRPTKFNLQVDFFSDYNESKTLSYTFYGVRPKQVKMVDAEHDRRQILLRNVTFMFDTVFVDHFDNSSDKPRTNILPRRNKFVDIAERVTGVAEDVLVKVDNIEKVVDNL